MHPVWLLFVAMPVVVVEPGEIYRPGRIAAGMAVHQRLARYRHDRTADRTGRPVQPVSLSHHRQLQLGVSQGTQPDGRDRPYPPRTAQGRQLSKRALLRSEEHTSELQSRENLVCRLLLEKKKISSL